MGRRGQHVPLVIPGDAGDAHGFVILVEEFCTDLATRGYTDAPSATAASSWPSSPIGSASAGSPGRWR